MYENKNRVGEDLFFSIAEKIKFFQKNKILSIKQVYPLVLHFRRNYNYRHNFFFKFILEAIH